MFIRTDYFKHSYFRITLLRSPIGKNLHSTCFHKYPVSTCSAPCEETTFYLKNYRSSIHLDYLQSTHQTQDLLLGESTSILQEENSSNLLLNWNKDSTIRSLHMIGISLGQFEFYVYRNYILQ